ncbi:aspartokinase [Skeletonema marinoi]|uniref:aspartate kinase n=1 Tax=Skeletonema marinoi TaxID=267567 RepID=A0AAD8XZR6_9STRA|nr:aspartokinase [Skeletonema marinoi]
MVDPLSTALLMTLSLLLLAAVATDAFVSPSHHYGRQQLTKYVVSNHRRLGPFHIIDNAHSRQILYMTENDNEEIDETGAYAGTSSDGTIEEEESPSEVISSYKSKISTRRTGTEARPGSSAQTPIDVTMKFGGSSLANAERIDHVANLIKDRTNPPPNEDGSPSGENPVRPRAVICSAMGKTTNSLLAAGEMALEGRVDIEALRTLHLGTCRKFDIPERTRNDVEKLLDECEDMLNGVRLIQELSPKSLDQLVSYGERCSVRIMAARLNQIGVPAQAFDAWDVGVLTDDTYGDAKLLPGTIASIKERFDGRVDPNVVAVVTGFIGHNTKGKITTLGRGGSDLTATAIGAALKVDEVQVWKDVDGILTADPRLVKNALPVSHVSYEEASELAYFGAQVLHPIAMQPALHANIPVRVKNSYNPSAPGSLIDNVGNPSRMVTAITCKRNITLMDITSLQMLGAYGFLGAVFADFEKNKVSVDVLASSEVSISVTLDKKQKENDIEKLRDDLSNFAEVELHRDRAILTLITDVSRSSDVLATVFATFSMHGIQVEMMSQGASKVNISFIIRDDQIDDAILKLHACLFEGKCDVAIIEDGHIV